MSKKQKHILKWLLVLIFLAAIVYTFRDSAGPILLQLKMTSPAVIAGICMMTVAYHLVEGMITTAMARQYNPAFPYKKGVGNAFYCSFYRVATLGSGAGVAAIYYLGENGIAYAEGFGMYMLQYAFHKIGIALFSAILFFICRGYMLECFGDYTGMLLTGYGITFAVAICLILLCCSKKFHKLTFALLDTLNRIWKGKLDVTVNTLRQQCQMMEQASKVLLKNKMLLIGILLLDLLKYGFWYGIPWLIFREQGGGTLLQNMAVTSLSVMLAAVIPTPAGIGSTEFVFTLLFGAIVGTKAAASGALLYRFATFVIPFLLGAVLVFVRRMRAHYSSGSRAR
jgi:hypothetical protein